jgi:multisubunit Na+/H+ antiporter MnhF subunit
MHEPVFYAAAVWMTVLLGMVVVLLLRAGSALVRILALDTLTLILIALLIVYADVQQEPYYVDAALILALLSFVSTLAATRFHSEGETFS